MAHYRATELGFTIQRTGRERRSRRTRPGLTRGRGRARAERTAAAPCRRPRSSQQGREKAPNCTGLGREECGEGMDLTSAKIGGGGGSIRRISRGGRRRRFCDGFSALIRVEQRQGKKKWGRGFHFFSFFLNIFSKCISFSSNIFLHKIFWFLKQSSHKRNAPACMQQKFSKLILNF